MIRSVYVIRSQKQAYRSSLRNNKLFRLSQKANRKSFLTLKLDGPADEPWVGLHGSDPHLRRVVGEEPGGDVDVLAADEDPDGVLADERRGELAGERPVVVGSDLRGAAAAVGALKKGIQLIDGGDPSVFKESWGTEPRQRQQYKCKTNFATK